MIGASLALVRFIDKKPKRKRRSVFRAPRSHGSIIRSFDRLTTHHAERNNADLYRFTGFEEDANRYIFGYSGKRLATAKQFNSWRMLMTRVFFALMGVFACLWFTGCSNSAKGSAASGKPSAEGMTVLPSGLKYRVVKAGTGNRPTADNTVEVHYRGRFTDGKEFDSSYQRGQPASFPVKGVIKGWTEALQLMTEGSKWELSIPPDLAYGKAGMPPVIPPDSTLFFEVELLKILR
jgi:hypothetical protein